MSRPRDQRLNPVKDGLRIRRLRLQLVGDRPGAGFKPRRRRAQTLQTGAFRLHCGFHRRLHGEQLVIHLLCLQEQPL